MAHRNQTSLRTLLAALAAASALAGCYETTPPVEPVCATVFAPVCGDDGVTYANSCLAENAGAAVAHAGPCRTGNTCTDNEGCDIGTVCQIPFCGAERCRPGVPCTLPPGCDPLPSGTCEVCACPEIYAPVCGADGLTYGNECEATCGHTTVAHSGECGTVCEPLACPAIFCEFGNAVDANGCGTCACNPPPVCAAILCDRFCEYGSVIDARGCETCECNPGPICPDLACAEFCEFGNLIGEDGCPTCGCNPPPICPDYDCASCEFGNVIDERGCATCECLPPPCPEVLCGLFCEFGYATDPRGCSTCECNPPTPTDVCATDAECTAEQYCDFSMPTCTAPLCIPGEPCPPARCYGTCETRSTCLPVTCDLFCEFGFARDATGCETCSCNPPPPPPPPVRLCLDASGCGRGEYCDHSVCFTAPCPPGMACPAVCYGACSASPDGGGGPPPTPR